MDQPEDTPTIKHHLNVKTIVASVIITLVAAGVVYGSYNFYLSLDRYQVQNKLVQATTAENNDNYTQAIALRNELITLDPENTDNLLALARLYYEVNENKKTVETLTLLQGKMQLPTEGLLLLGKTYLRTNNIDSAEMTLESIDDVENHTEGQFLLAMIKTSRKEDGVEDLLKKVANAEDTNETIQSFYTTWKEAQETDNTSYAHSLLTYALLEADQPYLALQLITPVVEAVPKYRDAHYLQAVAYYKTEQNDKAIEAAHRALEIDPEHKASQDILALLEEAVTPTPSTEPTTEATPEA